MRLRLRLMWLIISSFWKKPIVILDEATMRLSAFPNDVDITKITTDRYHALMDLGRMDYSLRCGLRKAMVKYKWSPVATFSTIRFRYPLKVFQRYQLRTKIIWWDDKAFLFEHSFVRNERIVATGYVYSSFLDSNGLVSPDKIVAIAGADIEKPDEPDVVSMLREVDNLIHKFQKD